ncbi:non-heme iron oxygenase ferredoxin subunit [Austwickia chelonae]|uniref:non-heme iron oxygenase ferredoxin subunit n=1 Tax=Austwickia chelonae TaxID=100225 RepID=UPI000E253151|nr:non-heme iron oxygenase ferredoxin subunit [Austwickia chelonae]
MSFQRACSVDDIPDTGAFKVDIDGARSAIAIVRDEEGTIHAVEDECSHGSVSLSEGEVDGSCIECWLHGSAFDLRTGEPQSPPATAAILVYPVRLEGDDIFVDVSAPTNA